jgi:hypothetical protein
MKVCFYDKKTDSLVAVEDWLDSPDLITITSLYMAKTYQSGRHRMPSNLWVAFDGDKTLRIFHLDEHPSVDENVLNRIKLLTQL